MPDLQERLTSVLADRYTIVSEIGRGGMATVFLAEDLRHHRQVAIKVLHPELAASVGSDRFLREIDAVASLTHPHVLPLFDSGELDGLLFYVMPYVEGESLRRKLDREKQLPIDEAIRITQDVGGALDHAHRHGLIHRDVKPGNILLEEGHAVVADFGVARAFSEAGEAKVTASGVAVGTPAYMSPEQASGEEVDERSDVYGLGCVLYEMLAGEPPLLGSTPQSTAAKRLTDRPTPLTALREATSPELSAAVDKALSRSPVDRYASAQQFCEAITHVRQTQRSKDLDGRQRRTRVVIATVGVAAVAILALILGFGPWNSETSSPRSAIAVLPFENLSPEGPNSYLAGGLHDELLTKLGKVASVRVISRASVRPYAETELSLKQIAEELGVGSIVEGTVQVVGDRLRVNVQLMDAHSEAQLWAETYDRTVKDAFAIQSDVAQRVVEAVGAALAEPDRATLAAVPTKSEEAYQYYLQAQEYFNRAPGGREYIEVAQQLYERALVLDPDFALAHVGLSGVHGRMYWLDWDPTPERMDAQLQEALAALRLDPNLPEAHLALGFWHYVRLDWPAALDEFDAAAPGMPNSARLATLVAAVHRRMGDWDQSLAAFGKAIELEPRSASLHREVALTYDLIRRYDDAIAAYDRSLLLAPDHHLAALDRAEAFIKKTGQRDTLRATLERIPRTHPVWYDGTIKRLFSEGKADSVLLVLGKRGTDLVSEDAVFSPALLTAARAYRIRGDTAAARVAFDSALALLDSAVSALPGDWRVHAARGRALAGLGRVDDALLEAEWLRESDVYRTDAFHGPLVAARRVTILVESGADEAALEEVERLLAGPSWFSIRSMPASWDPLRDQPGFQELLEVYQ